MHRLPCTLVFGSILCLLLAACAPQATLSTAAPTPLLTDTPIPPTAEPTATMLPPGLVAINEQGLKLGFACQGDGDWTVIFEAGLGMAGLSDKGIGIVIEQLHQSSLEPIRTCRYSRIGLPGSDPMYRYPSSEDTVKNLHNLVHNANIPGPYILVGHSLGGLFVRHYQSIYPEEVAGLVLIDALHEDWEESMAAAVPTASPAELAAAGIYPEVHNWKFSRAQWGELSDLVDLPLVVITADEPTGAESADKAWWELQDKLAALSTRSVHLHSPAGHNINLEDPAIVVTALEELVKMLQADP